MICLEFKVIYDICVNYIGEEREFFLGGDGVWVFVGIMWFFL